MKRGLLQQCYFQRYTYLFSLIFFIPIFKVNAQQNVVFDKVINENNIQQKPRTIVTTDGEIDDIDSFIRFLLYANEFKIEGLVYSSSQWHYSGDGKGTLFTSEMPETATRYGEKTNLRWVGTTWIQELIDKYAIVYPNLIKHADGYPSPEYLHSLIRIGNISFEGEMEKITEGSDLIKNVLLDADSNPVFLQVWGGNNTIARALKSIEEEYQNTPSWQKVYKAVSQKAIIYNILDQDATYKKYIGKNWPEIRVYNNLAQFWSFAYSWPSDVPDIYKPYLGGNWFAKNILFNHGPLLAEYYTWGDGRQLVEDNEHTHGNPENQEKEGRKKYDFISEGDSPSYLYLINVGLRSIENPSYGGWGGRMVPSSDNPYRWTDTNVADYNPYTNKLDRTYPQTRWIDVIQNDFAARADWCVLSYEEANHPPVVTLAHEADLIVKPETQVTLKGKAIDPDGDTLIYKWWQYVEAGTSPHQLEIEDSNSPQATVTIPSMSLPKETYHLIFEVKDSGKPQLTRYQRVILTVN